jgi:hypothetical protein
MTYHSFVNWTTSTGHMMEDGMLRMNRFLNRVAAGELLVTDRASPTRPQSRRTGVHVAAASFVVSLLVVVTGENAHLGINMFTAATLFVAASALMLFRTMGKLA